MTAKNPYPLSTPEGLLFANIESKRLEAVAWSADAERYTLKAQEARAQVDLFTAALAKLTEASA